MPGLHAHRVNEEGYNTMAGWYMPHGLYAPNELGGLSVTRFAEAVRAEGSQCTPGTNKPLHLHPLLTEADVYGHDRPTRIAHASRDLIREQGSLASFRTNRNVNLRYPVVQTIRPRNYF